MSPTSYQTAPPRTLMITTALKRVNAMRVVCVRAADGISATTSGVTTKVLSLFSFADTGMNGHPLECSTWNILSILSYMYDNVWNPMSIKKKRRTGKRRILPLKGLEVVGSGEEWRAYYRPLKKVVTIRIDADVLAWFRKNGRGYQTRINRALRNVRSEERSGS